MRGMDCLHIPTTLLAQIDSSIGGKTAIDFDGVKNLVGVFSQPTTVIIDIATLGTLPKREFLSGFGEIVKHGLISDRGYLQRVTSKHPEEFSNAELEKIVSDSCQIKARVVENDETESGPRKALNFGHTIGHAIESLSLDTDSPLLHGEAISIGMAVESDISAHAGLLPSKDAKTIKELLRKSGLPTTCPRHNTNAIISKLRSDKKNEFGSICFTLLVGIGNAVWNQTVDGAIVVGALEDNMEENI
jgi:3-dehydroquinate synthase